MEESKVIGRLNILIALAVLSVIMLTVIGLSSVNIGVLTIPAGKQAQPPVKASYCEKDEVTHTCSQWIEGKYGPGVEYTDGCEDRPLSENPYIWRSGRVGYYTCEEGNCVFHETEDCNTRQCFDTQDGKGECLPCETLVNEVTGVGSCEDDSGLYIFPSCEGNTARESAACEDDGTGKERCIVTEKECEAWQKCLRVYSMPPEGQPVTDSYVDCFDGCVQSGSICYSLSGMDSSAVDEDLYRPHNEYCRDNVRMVSECELNNPQTPGYCVTKEKPCAKDEKCQTKTVKSTSPQGKVYDVTVTECVKIQATTLTNPPTPTSITGTTHPLNPTTTLTRGSTSTTTIKVTPTSVTGSTLTH